MYRTPKFEIALFSCVSERNFSPYEYLVVMRYPAGVFKVDGPGVGGYNRTAAPVVYIADQDVLDNHRRSMCASTRIRVRVRFCRALSIIPIYRQPDLFSSAQNKETCTK